MTQKKIHACELEAVPTVFAVAQDIGRTKLEKYRKGGLGEQYLNGH